MSREDSQSITVKLDGTNYNHWSFLMRSFLKRKGMWKYVNGNEKEPTSSITDKLSTTSEEVWEDNNHKILTWIGNTVINSISMQLIGFELAKQAWDFFEKRYTQVNFVHKYKLEQDIRVLKQQHEQTITDFHGEMLIVWNQLALIEPRWTFDIALWEKYREESRLVLFLMVLREEFEDVRASMLHQSPLPTVEVALSELITEETRKRIKTYITYNNDNSVVLAAPWKLGYNSKLNSQKVSFNLSSRDAYQVECYNYKKTGHLDENCKAPSNTLSVQRSGASTT